MRRKDQICTLGIWAGASARLEGPGRATHQRLSKSFARMQDLQLVRNHCQDPRFGKAAEERIIWRELLELEIQAVDEQIERISASAGMAPN